MGNLSLKSFIIKSVTVCALALSVASLLIPASAHAATLITDGSFETPAVANILTISAGQTSIAPWVVNAGSVDVINQNSTFNTGPAFDGNQFLDLDGNNAGTITQAFSTVPSALYYITFAYGNNYAANHGPSSSATVQLFDGSGSLLLQTITHSTSVNGNLHWTPFSGQFTAVQNTTSLQFASLDAANSNGGIYLDGIAVTASPEPTSAALLGLGALLLAARRRQV